MSDIPVNNADRAPTATGLIEEVIDIFQRGENALFADLAHMTWTPQATLAVLAQMTRQSAPERRGPSDASSARPIGRRPFHNGHAPRESVSLGGRSNWVSSRNAR